MMESLVLNYSFEKCAEISTGLDNFRMFYNKDLLTVQVLGSRTKVRAKSWGLNLASCSMRSLVLIPAIKSWLRNAVLVVGTRPTVPRGARSNEHASLTIYLHVILHRFTTCYSSTPVAM